ncbi:MAG: 50S ribosomal protein L32 [Nannocystaceae bacterium]
MAVPKKKHSPSRRDMRRANHDKVSAPALVPCSNCQEMVLPHRVCPSCGYYKGREVLRIAQD